MNLEDLLEIVNARLSGVCVDVTLMRDYPGYVRSVFIRPNSRVVIEFEQYGLDEGGAYFYCDYPSLPSAVADLEEYFGRSLSVWDSHVNNESSPEPPSDIDVSEGARRLAEAISANAVLLPQEGNYELRGSLYWTQFKPK